MSILSTIFNKIFPKGHPTISTEIPTLLRPLPSEMKKVDVEEVLNKLSKNNPMKLNWQTSIVDLLKLLDLDSSLNSRKELAKELRFEGDIGDSAAMNLWLQKQVMKKLAENGGKVPEELRH